ncbi:MAG: hypothetical protein WDW36_005587 [Sanguina aurantia]
MSKPPDLAPPNKGPARLLLGSNHQHGSSSSSSSVTATVNGRPPASQQHPRGAAGLDQEQLQQSQSDEQHAMELKASTTGDSETPLAPELLSQVRALDALCHLHLDTRLPSKAFTNSPYALKLAAIADPAARLRQLTALYGREPLTRVVQKQALLLTLDPQRMDADLSEIASLLGADKASLLRRPHGVLDLLEAPTGSIRSRLAFLQLVLRMDLARSQRALLAEPVLTQFEEKDMALTVETFLRLAVHMVPFSHRSGWLELFQSEPRMLFRTPAELLDGLSDCVEAANAMPASWGRVWQKSGPSAKAVAILAPPARRARLKYMVERGLSTGSIAQNLKLEDDKFNKYQPKFLAWYAATKGA